MNGYIIYMKRNKAYCPYCKGERELRKPKIGVVAWVVISILTAGIGIVLYPIIFYSSVQKNRCHICGGKIARYIDRKPLFKEEN